MAWLLFTVVFVGTAGAGYFQLPFLLSTYNSSCDYVGSFKINGVDAQHGDEVAFFDPQGVLCGLYVVDDSGQYGVVHVYGDDPSTTEVDEGAGSGDVLTVKIWNASKEVELSGVCVRLSSGDPAGSFDPSLIPPEWYDKQGFILNIDTAIPPPADINADCEVNILDAMLALQVICGIEVLQFVTNKADLDGDHQIGLQEVIYILQEVAGMREK